jgi:hypothetical protein
MFEVVRKMMSNRNALAEVGEEEPLPLTDIVIEMEENLHTADDIEDPDASAVQEGRGLQIPKIAQPNISTTHIWLQQFFEFKFSFILLLPSY